MSFRKDVISMQFTALINIMAGFIYFPILARVFRFPPETFGQFQYINSLTMITMSFALLSLDWAFISDQEEQDQKQAKTAFSTMVLVGFLVFATSTFFLFLAKNYGLLDIETYFIIFIFLTGIAMTYERAFYALFREKKQFSYVAKERVLVSICHPTIGLCFALFFRNSYILLLAFAASHLLGALYFHRIAKRKGIMPGWSLDFRASKKLLKRNWNTVAFQTPSDFLKSTFGNLPILLLKKFFSEDILGFFSLSMRILGTANSLLSQGLYETFLPYVAKSQYKRELALNYFPLLCSIFFPAYFAASFLSSWYVPLLFGESFSYVSEIVRIMAPFYFTTAVTGPYLGFVLIYRRSEINLIINVLGIILRAGLFFLSSLFWGLSGGLFAISISGILVYFTIIIVATRLSNGFLMKISIPLVVYTVMLFVVSSNIVTTWMIPVFLLPSFLIIYKNRGILLDQATKVL